MGGSWLLVQDSAKVWQSVYWLAFWQSCTNWLKMAACIGQIITFQSIKNRPVCYLEIPEWNTKQLKCLVTNYPNTHEIPWQRWQLLLTECSVQGRHVGQSLSKVPWIVSSVSFLLRTTLVSARKTWDSPLYQTLEVPLYTSADVTKDRVIPWIHHKYNGQVGKVRLVGSNNNGSSLADGFWHYWH